MALTEQQQQQIHDEYRRRLMTVNLKRSDGSAVEFSAPISGYDLFGLDGLRRILGQLGYTIESTKDGVMRIGPKEGN